MSLSYHRQMITEEKSNVLNINTYLPAMLLLFVPTMITMRGGLQTNLNGFFVIVDSGGINRKRDRLSLHFFYQLDSIWVVLTSLSPGSPTPIYCRQYVCIRSYIMNSKRHINHMIEFKDAILHQTVLHCSLCILIFNLGRQFRTYVMDSGQSVCIQRCA